MSEVFWSDRINELKQKWTDRYVRPREDRSELARFMGRVGRVVTVNCSGKVLVDFADGAWVDVPASEDWLQFVDDEEAQAAYNSEVNSAQPLPARQG